MPPYSPLSFTPAIRQVAPFGPYSLAGYPCPGNNTPSADSHCAMGAPCGLLTRGFCMLSSPFFVFLTLKVRLVRGQDAISPDAGDFVSPVFPNIPVG
jgi:hypothetical protein